ncbi:MAG: sensor histidine kinase [Ardenticatenia bacterium]|nr:sensor histidine kinase [Ardenticatenia bacterium]
MRLGHSLRVQIALWGVLPVLVLFITFSLTGVQSHRRSMRALIVQRNALLGQVLAREIAHRASVYPRTLDILAEIWPSATAPHVQALLPPGMVVVRRAPGGEVNVLGEMLPSAEDIERWNRVTWMESPATLFDDVPALVWRRSLGGEEVLLGWVPLLALELDTLIASTAISPYAGLALVADGRPVYRVGNSAEDVTALLLIPDQADAAYAVSVTPVAGLPWELVIVEPWELLTAPFFRLDRWLPFLVGGAIFFSSLALFYGVQTLVRPLHLLAQQARAIGRGEFEAVDEPVRGVREVERVWHALRQMAVQVRDYQDALKRYIGRLTRLQEEERRRLARELHDGVVQDLIALDHRVQRLQRLVADAQVRAQLTEVRRHVDSLIAELRRTCQALRPLYLEELGLVPALEMIARDAGAHFAVIGTPRRLDPETELALYRMAQEALNNAKRHAHARHIHVRVEFMPSALHLQVRDDGVGFHVPAQLAELTAAGHFGLLSLTERAHLIGARLTVTSAPGAGTTVDIHLPRHSSQDPQ